VTRAKLEDLLEAIYRSPESFDLRAVAADLAYEEGDDALSEALRFSAVNRKRAYLGVRIDGRWSWYDEDRAGKSGIDPESDLPAGIFASLPFDERNINSRRDTKYYPSLREAEEALVSAFRNLRVAGEAGAR
jgi:hypothetical protein